MRELRAIGDRTGIAAATGREPDARGHDFVGREALVVGTDAPVGGRDAPVDRDVQTAERPA